MSKEKDELTLDTENERAKLISQATGWLLEMELLNNPHMKNTLMLNVYKVSDHIKDVQLLVDTINRKMLVYLELSGFGRLFKKREISSQVLDMLQQALASYTFRVTLDQELFAKSLKGFEAAHKRADELVKAAKAVKKTKQESPTPQPATPTSQEPVSETAPQGASQEGTETKE